MLSQTERGSLLPPRLDVGSPRLLIERPRELALAGAAVVAGALAGLAASAVSPLVMVGLLLGTGWAALVLRQPLIGVLSVFGVCLLLPFGVVPLPGASLRPTLLDVALTLTLLAWVLAVAARQASGAVGTPLDLPVLGLLLALLVAFLAGLGHGISAEGGRLFAKLLNSLVFFYSVTRIVRDERDVRQAAATLALGGGLAAAVGIALYAAPPEVAVRLLSALRPLGYPSGAGVLRYIADTNVLRAIGTNIDPNVFGATLLMTGVLAAAGSVQCRPYLDRRLLAGVALVTLVCLLLTRSRGSLAGAVAGLGCLALLRYRRLGLGLAAAGAVFLLDLVPDSLNPVGHFLTGLRAGDRATQMRLGEYRDALSLIAQYPWVGVGFGNAPALDLYVGVSSAYLLAAEQSGLVGLAAFLLVFGVLFVWALTSGVLRSRRPTAEIAVAALAAIVGALVGALADHHYFNQRFPHTVALLWGLVGLAAAAIRLHSAEACEEQAGR